MTGIIQDGATFFHMGVEAEKRRHGFHPREFGELYADLEITITGRQGAGKSRIADRLRDTLVTDGYAVTIHRDGDSWVKAVPAHGGNGKRVSILETQS